MRNLLFVFCIALVAIFSSCSSENASENISDSKIEFQFEIVDSLILDYLGTPLLCDFSPNQERILFFNNQNNEFIITDADGEIIGQFSKKGDIPDNPGSLADRPIFYDNNTVIAHGQKGIWAYDLEGKNVWKIEREQSLGYWFSKSYGRSMYLLEPKHYFTVINYDQLVLDASSDSLYENQHALKIVNKKTRSIEPVIPLEPFSRFLDGKGYQPASMLPSNHVRGNQMVVSYGKEEMIYLYEWRDLSFELTDTFSLKIEPFYLDEGKERESLKGQAGFVLGGKMGEAEVRGSWLLEEDQVLVHYNRGVKKSERQEAKTESVGENSFRLVAPENIPADQFQLYRSGEKFGQPFKLLRSLSTLLYIEGKFVWFKKNNEALGVEDDYAVFYKTKLVKQE